MAFVRRKRNLEFEFITVNNEKLVFEAEYSSALGDKLATLGEEMQGAENMADDEIKLYLIKAYDEILGHGAMAKIKAEVFAGDDISLQDLVDIGQYIILEVEKSNQMLAQTYSNPLANVYQEKPNAGDEIQRLLNGNTTNQLPH